MANPFATCGRHFLKLFDGVLHPEAAPSSSNLVGSGMSGEDEDNNEVDMKCSLRAEAVVKELQEAAAAVANGSANGAPVDAASSAGRCMASRLTWYSDGNGGICGEYVN